MRIASQVLKAKSPSGIWASICPNRVSFAAGLVFLPQNDPERGHCKQTIEKLINDAGQELIGWRDVPQETDLADVGPTARNSEPVIEMLFVGAADGLHGDAFERKLYMIHKQASHALRGSKTLKQALVFYICSLSTKVIIYKGMLTPAQVLPYFPGLA